MTAKTAEMIECPRCGGSGRFNCYAHVEGGVCFQCNGAGVVKAPRKPSAKEMARRAAKEAAAKAAAEKTNEARNQIIAANWDNDRMWTALNKRGITKDHAWAKQHVIESAEYFNKFGRYPGERY